VSFLPFADKAEIPIEKLRDYALSENHEEGKNKAYLFKILLGFSSENADDLKEMILSAILVNEAKEGRIDIFGKRYTVDFKVEKVGRTVTLRTGWIVKTDTLMPTPTTCYIIKE
jgi:hypothetical protein